MFGSSRFFVGWRTDRRNRNIANQGKEEVIVAVTVADLVVETFELAGADLISSKYSIAFFPPLFVLLTTILELPVLFFNTYF